MSVVNVHATIECDGCGCQFRVEVDAATPARKGRTFFDLAVDAIRGGACHVTATARSMGWSNIGSCSVQNDKHLCPACTRQADQDDEDGLP